MFSIFVQDFIEGNLIGYALGASWSILPPENQRLGLVKLTARIPCITLPETNIAPE